MKIRYSLLLLISVLLLLIYLLHIFFQYELNKESMDSISNSKKYKIGPSDIHGNGIICTQPINNKENIDVAFTLHLFSFKTSILHEIL